MAKTKNHRKLRRRRGGDPDPVPVPAAPAPGTGLGPAPGTGTGTEPAPGPGQTQATGLVPDSTQSSASFLSPPAIGPTPQRPLVPGPVQGTPPPVPPPAPSFFGKLLEAVARPFKKKEVETQQTQQTQQTNQGGLFSNSNVSIFRPSTWFGGKSKRHIKNKRSKANKKATKKKH